MAEPITADPIPEPTPGAAAVVPPVDAPAAPQAAAVQADLDAITNGDDIIGFLDRNAAAITEADANTAAAAKAKEAAAAEPVKDEPAAPAPEPTAEEKAEQEEADHLAEEAKEEAADTAAGKKPTNRFRFQDEADQQVAAVAKAMKISLIEAAKIITDRQTKANPPGTAPAAPAPRADGLPATAEATAAKLTELRAARTKARTEYSDIFRANELTEEIEVLMDHQNVMRAHEQRIADQAQRQQQEQGAAAAQASMQKAVDSYPLCTPAAQATEQGKAFTAEMQRIFTQLETDDNPIVRDPNFYFRVAQMAGNNLGIAPGSPAPKAPTARAATPTARPAARPAPIVPGTARTTAPVKAPDDLGKKLDAVGSIEEFNQMMGIQGF